MQPAYGCSARSSAGRAILARGDVERLQVGAAEARHRRAAHRQRHLAQQLAGGRQAQQALRLRTSRPSSSPRRRPRRRRAGRRSRPAPCAGLRREAARTRAGRLMAPLGGSKSNAQTVCAVVSVQYIVRAVGAPGQAVADRDAADGAARARRREAVERRRGRIARLVDRADPEAPGRIALAVVEALVGRVVGRRRELRCARRWPDRSATGRRASRPASVPSRRGAKLPTSVSNSQCAQRAARRIEAVEPVRRECRSTRAPARSGCQTGDSPSSAGDVDGDADVAWCSPQTTAMSSFIQASSVCPGRERDQAVRGRVGHVDRVADVADRLDAEVVALAAACRRRGTAATNVSWSEKRSSRIRAGPRQPSKQLSKSRCDTSLSMPGCATLRVGSCVASVSQRCDSSMCRRLRARLTKYGCQPRPTGCSTSAVVGELHPHAERMRREREVLARARTRTASRRRRRGAARARPRARSTRRSRHGRCQPTPCSECGRSAKLARSCSRGRASGSGGSRAGSNTAPADSIAAVARRAQRRRLGRAQDRRVAVPEAGDGAAEIGPERQAQRAGVELERRARRAGDGLVEVGHFSSAFR